jgi:hypothetical protein
MFQTKVTVLIEICACILPSTNYLWDENVQKFDEVSFGFYVR